MEKCKVYSSLAETVVFVGTEDECKNYKQKHENNDNSLYILKNNRGHAQRFVH